MKNILILYCPLCGQGMFINKNCKDKGFRCINTDCATRLRLMQEDDGSMYLENNLKVEEESH